MYICICVYMYVYIYIICIYEFFPYSQRVFLLSYLIKHVWIVNLFNKYGSQSVSRWLCLKCLEQKPNSCGEENSFPTENHYFGVPHWTNPNWDNLSPVPWAQGCLKGTSVLQSSAEYGVHQLPMAFFLMVTLGDTNKNQGTAFADKRNSSL